MKILTLDQFTQLIAQATQIKPRLKRELRFATSTGTLTAEDWQERELLPITDKTGRQGVLLLQPDEQLFLVPFEITRGLASATGRAKPIICDFCRTWQAGTNAASISFKKDIRSFNSVTYLCCADLACSLHVRGNTPAAIHSRAQLREDITNEQRIERLKERLRTLIADLQLPEVM